MPSTQSKITSHIRKWNTMSKIYNKEHTIETDLLRLQIFKLPDTGCKIIMLTLFKEINANSDNLSRELETVKNDVVSLKKN